MTPKKYDVRLFNQGTPNESWMLRCPQCKGLGVIDEDQLKGKVSIFCDCGFHETINLTEYLEELPQT